jgi:hypothetical protein
MSTLESLAAVVAVAYGAFCCWHMLGEVIGGHRSIEHPAAWGRRQPRKQT